MSLTSAVVGIITAVIVLGAVLVPIVSAMTVTTIDVPGGTNENPVSELRLTYTEDKTLMMGIEAYINDQDTLTIGVWLDIDSQDPTYMFEGITEDVIVFGSDNYSVVYQDGQLITSIYGQAGSPDNYASLMVAEGYAGTYYSRVPYTFVYYPDPEGEYANYQSYEFDAGSEYAVGIAYGITASAKNGVAVGDTGYTVTAQNVTENGEVVGVDFQISAGSGDIPGPDPGPEPYEPIVAG